ncbi:MAG TPA: hypothetical protein ENI46_02135, partial [Firmicutes bacterium]|nr:hypothetical protein [Bacillota bacterium]
VHLIPILRRARKNGCFCVLIDPVATATSRLVDWHISLAPGSDLLLAIGMARILIDEGAYDRDFIKRHTVNFERFRQLISGYTLEDVSEKTGVNLSDLRELARRYGNLKPGAILGGWGLQRRRTGAQVYRLLDAIAALSGNIGVAGGGVSHGVDEMRWFDLSVGLADRAQHRREIPKPRVWRGILECGDPPIRLLFVTGANPVSQCPNASLAQKAMARVDFKVVVDMFMTDTASLADLVLPATHFLQETDLVGSYWHNYIMPVNQAQPPIGEEKTDFEIFALLARKLGLARDFPDDPLTALEMLIEPLKREGYNLRDLREHPVRPRSAVDVPFRDRKFWTSSGRFEFITDINMPPSKVCPEYPYHLLTPHPHDRTHSQTRGIPARAYPEALVSNVIARTHGIESGSLVRVTTANGELTCTARIDSSLRDDVVVIPEGSWEMSGGAVNRLTSDDLSDEGECATYNDAACNVSRVV